MITTKNDKGQSNSHSKCLKRLECCFQSSVYGKLLCFFLLIIFSFSASAQKTGNIYALVVGVSEYAFSANNLNYPEKDAAEIYNLLVKHPSTDKIKLLVNRSATRSNILQAANQLFTNTNSNDIVIFYFSGHGFKGGFCAHDNDFQYTELKKIFQRTKANRKIILADACYAGDMRTSNAQKSPINVDNQKVCLFLSSRSDQTSMESLGLKNGFFTYFLVAGLRGGADADRNKIITARELFEFVNPKVKQYSDGSQVPVMWGKFENSMEILNWNN